ncbi:MAG TPA: hypothetical protein VE685_16940 [Thermoanaerobaculia bacterium]|nr:hypothetical protein [Thermoanaerobaculia bacterium]
MKNRTGWRTWTLVVAGLALAAGAAYAQPLPPECEVPPNTSGTVTLPPPGCEYLTGDQVHLIINGLPQGTVIVLDPIHERFICEVQGGGGDCGSPGGNLGGEREIFGSTLRLRMSGTGALSGWSRTIPLSANCETHTGPQTAGATTDTFATDMHRLEGTLTNDPDFAYLHVVAGTGNGLPSPGSTTVTLQPDGTYKVDSHFNIRYRITFQGAPGGRLDGFGGTTEGSVTMRSFDLEGETDCP